MRFMPSVRYDFSFRVGGGLRGHGGWARTLRVQHLFDGPGDAGGVAADDELEAVVGD